MFLAKNPLFKTATPAYVAFNGKGIEAGGRSDLSHPSLKNKKLKSPKERKELVMKPDLKENPLMKLGGVGGGEAETFLNEAGGTPSIRKKNVAERSGVGAGDGSMLLAASRSGSKSGSGSAQISAMSSSKINLETSPGVRSGAPNDTENGGDPGGDPTKPPIPVGDGVWILLIMSAGYMFYRRKRQL